MTQVTRRTAMGAMVSAIAPAVLAQDSFPSKPIRIVVPFPPGGAMDPLARALARELSDKLKSPVVVENKTGGATMIAADFVAKSAPDGYNIMFATDGTVSINPLVYTKMPYNAQTDLIPLTVVTHVPEFFYVPTSLPVRTLREFIALAKQQPGKLNYGSYGNGSQVHLEMEFFKEMTKTDVTHVPYRGASEVMPAMAAGDVQATITSYLAAVPFMQSGKIKALAVMAKQRFALLPDVPTFVEEGVPGLDTNAWFGLMLPAKTPAAVVDKLNSEIGKILATAEFREKYISALGMSSAPAGAGYFSDVLKNDRIKYAQFVKIAKITPQ